MNILIVSHEYPPVGGGGANACLNLTKEYSKLGHQVTVITVWYNGLKEEEKYERIHIIRLKSKRKYLEHCSFIEMLDYLCKAFYASNISVKEERYDICQVFFAIPSGPIGYYLKKRYKVPYVIRFGGGDIPGFQERFQCIYKLIAPFEKIIWKNADALVANSIGLKKLACDFYNKKRIEIITNGVDKKLYDGHKEIVNNRKIRLLFVSRLIERKGIQFILPKLAEIDQKSEKEVTLTIVGDGPFRAELEKIAEEKGVSGLANFVGQKEKGELSNYYYNSDIFILPSKKEGMPNVVLEAMACGLPVIMTPCEGSTELIQGNGFIATIEDFAERIVELCRDDDLRNRMGKRSKEIIEEQFGWERIAGKYEKLFREVIEK